MAARTMAHTILARTQIVVFTADAPSKQEWDIYMEGQKRDHERFHGILVYSDGGGPGSAQREQTRLLLQQIGRTPPMAILTQSPVARGVVIALSWFIGGRIKAFAPRDLASALAHVGMPLSEADAAWEAIQRLRAELGLPRLTTKSA